MRPLTLLATLALTAVLAAAEDPPDLETLAREAAAHPASVPHQLALAEACLHECRLERSLGAFRAVLALDPDHARAQAVVARLSAQALDLDTHLSVLEDLLDAGPIKDLDAILDAAAKRAATDDQQARIRYLRSRAAVAGDDLVAARGHWLAILKLYPDSPVAGAAAGMLAFDAARTGHHDQADTWFTRALAHPTIAPRSRQLTLLHRAAWLGRGHELDRQIALYTALAAELDDPVALARYHRELVPLLVSRHPDGLAAAELLGRWRIDPQDDAGRGALLDLAAEVGRGPATGEPALAVLDGVLATLAPLRPRRVNQRDLLRAELLRRRMVLAGDPAAVGTLAEAAAQVLAGLEGRDLTGAELSRARSLAEDLLMTRAQKLAALDRAGAALPVLRRARELILEGCGLEPDPGAVARLTGIGRLYEGLGEWELAADHHRRLEERFPHLPLGRDALLRRAEITERHLRDDLGALELYAAYAGRYPAELTYRQMRLGERLRRLGFASVVDLQRRMLLPADGIFGPDTRRKLEELERTFDQISLPAPGVLPAVGRGGGAAAGEAPILKGAFVHPRMFAIARGLETRGRHHAAVGAYRLFLNLFPTKREADDALIAIARIFRRDGLFEEALGAYRQLMADFPKGDRTSEAYVEGARCLIDLGRWDDARDLLALYVKQFPRKEHVTACRRDIAALEEIRQYADFIAGHPDHPKLAEAGYQIGAILYQRLGSPRRAAVEFGAVAAAHPRHIRAADALYTAGTARLKLEDFAAARELYARVVAGYADNRLADDAQYWIGHSYEYQARALGKLDAARIVLKRRSHAARRALLADLALRRLYHPAAGPVPDAVLAAADELPTGAAVQDRVGEDLRAAIVAYRKVVDDFELGDKAGNALLRIGVISTDYLKNTEKGVAAYRELLAKYPGSKEAVDALYNVGAHQKEAGDFEEAIASYKKFIFSYPEAGQVEQAMVDIAACYAARQQWDQALDAYKSYLNKFPQGRFVKTATAQIDWIRMYHF